MLAEAKSAERNLAEREPWRRPTFAERNLAEREPWRRPTPAERKPEWHVLCGAIYICIGC
jgi:hypothetical protein